METTLRHYLAPAVLGADPADLADVHARMERAIRPSFSVGQPLAKAAIDLACHDLWGRQSGRSVSALLGGARCGEVKLSWTVQSPTLAGAEMLLAQGRALGYSSYNVKLGHPQTPQYDARAHRAWSAVSRPTAFTGRTRTRAYDLETALAMAPKLADAGFAALESPLPPDAHPRLPGAQAAGRGADPDG